MTQSMLGLMSKVTLFSLDVTPKPIHDFQKTNYTTYISGKTLSLYDEAIRKSQDTQCQQPQFTACVAPIIQQYLLKSEENVVSIDDRWRMMKYEGGHFVQHCDRIRDREGYVHFGTQILLPPKEICDYEGGVLEIKENGKIQLIKPVNNMWTHIILPLGIFHSISNVKGTRVSYVKQIYLEKKPQRKYDLPKFYLQALQTETDVEDDGSGSTKPKPSPKPNPLPRPLD